MKWILKCSFNFLKLREKNGSFIFIRKLLTIWIIFLFYNFIPSYFAAMFLNKRIVLICTNDDEKK